MTSINPTAATASLPLTTAQPASALASPYDATAPTLGTPTLAAPTMTGLPAGYAGSGVPQTNATNQTAIAPNGNVNQQVTNSNQYTNKYYNIIVPNQGVLGWSGLGGLGSNPLSSWATQGNSFVDPKTGVLYVQQEQGIGGWFKRLFRGY